jgi:cytoskeletal protein RodZ
MLVEELNSSNARAAPSSLAVLVLLKLLQYKTERYFFLIVYFLSPWLNYFVQALYVAPRPRPQQQSQSHVQGPTSQSQPTATSTSTTTVQVSATTAQSPPVPLWARLVLFICCASPSYANGH